MTVTGKQQMFVMRDWMMRHGYADGGEPEARAALSHEARQLVNLDNREWRARVMLG